MIEQQLKVKQSSGGGVGAANGTAVAVAQQQVGAGGGMQAGVAGAGGAAAAAAAASGQPDYSKQWAEYYRSIGKIDEAEAIENQIKATKVRFQKQILLSQHYFY